jgi:hypothetical protein
MIMAGGVAFLLATLIGVFITPDGIVVGTDTALSNLTGQVATQQKYCVTGPRSVATLQGSYLLQDVVTKATIELYERFRDLCSQLDDSTRSATLREQAEYIAAALKSDLATFLESLPADEVVRMYSSTPVVARVAVTGYSDKRPESVVVGIGIATDRATNRWEVQVRDLSRLTFTECGVRFQGQESVVTALRTDTDARISRAERQNAEVAKLSALIRGACADASIRTAPSMFVQAVRLTVTLGIDFGLAKGTVGMPVDVIVIPREGPIDVTRVESW